MPPGWPAIPEGSPFPDTNLPYGVAAPAGEPPRVVVPLGTHALDLAAVAAAGLLDTAMSEPAETFRASTLNPFLAAGPAAWRAVRARLQELLAESPPERLHGALLPLAALRPVLPFTVADYVDCYSSLDHAANVGRIFRPDGDPLPPSWRWQPLAYHGRAGTVVVSGTPIRRPRGPWLPAGATQPVVAPTEKLDIEVEVGCVVGVPTDSGQPIAPDAFADHVLGLVLVNDWSARDIQAWETVPLGPFLAKSFATTVSPWVVPLDALAAARVPAPTQEPTAAPHLQPSDHWGLDLALELEINGTVVSRPPFASMYWTLPQQLAHATSNGARLRTGDLLASGTVSGPEREQRGCLLELTWDGRDAIAVGDGSRRYLQDSDQVVIRATARGANGTTIGFGDCAGSVLPAS